MEVGEHRGDEGAELGEELAGGGGHAGWVVGEGCGVGGWGGVGHELSRRVVGGWRGEWVMWVEAGEGSLSFGEISYEGSGLKR